jgi:hypothetical protein
MGKGVKKGDSDLNIDFLNTPLFIFSHFHDCFVKPLTGLSSITIPIAGSVWSVFSQTR